MLPGFQAPEMAAVIGLRFRAGKEGQLLTSLSGLGPRVKETPRRPSPSPWLCPNPQQARPDSNPL